jgi:hypothetical protein
MRRKLWLLKVVCGFTMRGLFATVDGYAYQRTFADGRVPKKKDFWAICDYFGLEPEDFILTESVYIEKLREWRRAYVERTNQTHGKPGEQA